MTVASGGLLEAGHGRVVVLRGTRAGSLGGRAGRSAHSSRGRTRAAVGVAAAVADSGYAQAMHRLARRSSAAPRLAVALVAVLVTLGRLHVRRRRRHADADVRRRRQPVGRRPDRRSSRSIIGQHEVGPVPVRVLVPRPGHQPARGHARSGPRRSRSSPPGETEPGPAVPAEFVWAIEGERGEYIAHDRVPGRRATGRPCSSPQSPDRAPGGDRGRRSTSRTSCRPSTSATPAPASDTPTAADVDGDLVPDQHRHRPRSRVLRALGRRRPGRARRSCWCSRRRRSARAPSAARRSTGSRRPPRARPTTSRSSTSSRTSSSTPRAGSSRCSTRTASSRRCRPSTSGASCRSRGSSRSTARAWSRGSFEGLATDAEIAAGVRGDLGNVAGARRPTRRPRAGRPRARRPRRGRTPAPGVVVAMCSARWPGGNSAPFSRTPIRNGTSAPVVGAEAEPGDLR